ncbi:hypothetical protein [Krasilnikovia sp. MM14-A1259]|uniref:hypothetical protein n=1 Tax=Krasilnikovia sp. MM14-A1259 TaxID=3373539 RepID=UPI003803CCCC
MIVASLLLILVAVTLLVFGVAGGSSMLLISSIVASLLAAVALVVGARRASARRAAARDVGGALGPAATRTSGRDRDAAGGAPHAESAAFTERATPAAATAVYAGETARSGAAAATGFADEPGGTRTAVFDDEPSLTDDPGDPGLRGSTVFPEESDAPEYPDETGALEYGDDTGSAAAMEFGPDAPALDAGDAGLLAEPGAFDATDDHPLGARVDDDPGSGYDAPLVPEVGDDRDQHRDHADYDHASSVIDAARSQEEDESWRRDPGDSAARADDESWASDPGDSAAGSGLGLLDQLDVSGRPGPSGQPDLSGHADLLGHDSVSGTAPAGFTAGPSFDEPVEEFGRPDPDDPADEPLPQAERAADAVRIARMDAEVLVVDGRPRYHVSDCPHLVGRLTEPLPVSEAVELGFTPCGLCRPVDRLLAAAARG